MAKAKVSVHPNQIDVLIRCPGCETLHVLTVDSNTRPRWEWNKNIDKPTFFPSLLVKTGKYVHADYIDEPGLESVICHSIITDGKIKFEPDTTHKLRGQTVDLLDIEKEF